MFNSEIHSTCTKGKDICIVTALKLHLSTNYLFTIQYLCTSQDIFNRTTSTITFSKLQTTSKEGIRYAHLPLQDRCKQAKTFSPMEKMDDNHFHFMELYKANYTD